MEKTKTYFTQFICVLLIILAGCSSEKGSDQEAGTKKSGDDLTRIMESGKLKVVVDYNSTNYFVYRGRPMGFKYELLEQLAKEMGVKLEISVSNDLQQTFKGLRRKQYDLVAKNLTVTKNRDKHIDFTLPLEQTRQVLVQRKPEKWKEMSRRVIEESLIRNQLDLANKEIYVQKNTAYYRRLVNLSEEIGAEINILQDSIYGVEQLVALVAKGEIDFTVCDENVAIVNQTYYPNIDIKTPVSFPQNIAWAVRKDSGLWQEYLNNWIRKFKKTAKYRIIYRKYFENSRSKQMVKSDFHSIHGGKISPYDEIVKAECSDSIFDWRLVSALMYHESNFKPEAQSWMGAYGLMQIMPESADLFRIVDYEEPDQNIKVGVKLLKWLNKNLVEEIPDSTERVKFVLASYNVGLGHVKDAQRLAKKYGKSPTIWQDNVDFYLLNKSASKYYKDPVVRWGYCRGEEPYNYVNKVLKTYGHYLNIIQE